MLVVWFDNKANILRLLPPPLRRPVPISLPSISSTHQTRSSFPSFPPSSSCSTLDSGSFPSHNPSSSSGDGQDVLVVPPGPLPGVGTGRGARADQGAHALRPQGRAHRALRRASSSLTSSRRSTPRGSRPSLRPTHSSPSSITPFPSFIRSFDRARRWRACRRRWTTSGSTRRCVRAQGAVDARANPAPFHRRFLSYARPTSDLTRLFISFTSFTTHRRSRRGAWRTCRATTCSRAT